jgi:hypothetical protein
MKNTTTWRVRQFFGALLLWGAIASVFAAGASQRATVSGIDIYYGMVPAQLAAKHPLSHEERFMHGGVKGAKDAYHLVVALFDADGKRITMADVRANIAELGMAGTNHKLEAMQIDGATSYGAYFVLSGDGPYRITVDARLPGAAAPIQATFDYTRN